jgi:hypothetical protein
VNDHEYESRQAKYKSAYDHNGDPMILIYALHCVWHAKRPIPDWLVSPLSQIASEARRGHKLEREREVGRHVRRYECVRDLRQGGNTKDRALDQAVELLKSGPAAAARATIEESYDLVRRDLERKQYKSEFYFCILSTDEVQLSNSETERLLRASDIVPLRG